MGSRFKELFRKMQIHVKWLVFYTLLYKFKIKQLNKGAYYRFIHPFRFWVLTFFFFILGTFLANYIVSNFATNLLRNDSVTFFTAVGAMLGAVLAIVFTLSNLQIQNAAQQSSAGFYEILGRDPLRDVALIFIAILSFGFFVLAIISTTPNALNFHTLTIIGWFSILILGFVFWILFALYYRSFERIRPQTSLLIVRDAAFKLLNNIVKYASEITKITMSQPSLPEEATEEIATSVSFQKLKPLFDAYNARLDHLFDYHDKLYASQEKRMARQVLSIVYEILQHYFHLRRKSSLIIPWNEFPFVGMSDSQEFLTPNLEQLVSKGQMYITQNENAGITHTIDIFSNLTVAATGIQFASNRSGENPIFNQCRGNFDQMMQTAIEQYNIEALFQGVKAYARIGQKAFRAKLQDEPISIYNKLDEIAIHAMAKGTNIVWGEVMRTYAFLFEQLVASEMPGMEIQIKMLVEHMRTIVLLGSRLLSQRTTDSIFTLQSNIAIPLHEVKQTLFNIVHAVSQTEDDTRKDDLKSKFLIGIEELRRGLRFLSEEMKSADYLLVGDLAKINSEIGCLLFSLMEDERWQEEREELIKHARWYLHQPGWFFHHADGAEGGGSFDALVESVTKMGLCALKANQDDLAKGAIDALSQFAMEMLTKERGKRYGFTEPRIMKRACFIGILAIRQGKQEVVGKLKERIAEFEPAYKQQWFSDVPEGVELTSPRPEQLQIEIMRLRGKVQEKPSHWFPSLRICSEGRSWSLSNPRIYNIWSKFPFY